MDSLRDPFEISSRQELVAYLAELAEQVSSNEGEIELENSDLAGYIESASAWIDGMDEFFRFRGEQAPEQPSWGMIGAIFTAALFYE